MDSLAAECTETARQIRRDKAGAVLCQLKWDGERGEYQDAGAAGTPGGDASALDGETAPSPRGDSATPWPAVGGLPADSVRQRDALLTASIPIRQDHVQVRAIRYSKEDQAEFACHVSASAARSRGATSGHYDDESVYVAQLARRARICDAGFKQRIIDALIQSAVKQQMDSDDGDSPLPPLTDKLRANGRDEGHDGLVSECPPEPIADPEGSAQASCEHTDGQGAGEAAEAGEAAQAGEGRCDGVSWEVVQDAGPVEPSLSEEPLVVSASAFGQRSDRGADHDSSGHPSGMYVCTSDVGVLTYLTCVNL